MGLYRIELAHKKGKTSVGGGFASDDDFLAFALEVSKLSNAKILHNYALIKHATSTFAAALQECITTKWLVKVKGGTSNYLFTSEIPMAKASLASASGYLTDDTALKAAIEAAMQTSRGETVTFVNAKLVTRHRKVNV